MVEYRPQGDPTGHPEVQIIDLINKKFPNSVNVIKYIYLYNTSLF